MAVLFSESNLVSWLRDVGGRVAQRRRRDGC